MSEALWPHINGMTGAIADLGERVSQTEADFGDHESELIVVAAELGKIRERLDRIERAIGMEQNG